MAYRGATQPHNNNTDWSRVSQAKGSDDAQRFVSQCLIMNHSSTDTMYTLNDLVFGFLIPSPDDGVKTRKRRDK